MRLSAILAVVLVASALGPPVFAAQPPQEDPTLPRPVKGQAPQYYIELANVHIAYRLWGSAETLYLRALELEQDKARKERLSFQLFGRIYRRAGWWDKAQKEILRTISLVEKDNIAQKRKYRIDRALALREGGKTDEYIRELELVVRMSGTEDEKRRSLRSLHLALKESGKLQPKLDEYEAWVKKNPKDEITLRLLAEIYWGNGLLDLPGKAIEKYERIRALNPDDVNACEHLARLFETTGQKDKAVKLYEGLMKLNAKRRSYYFIDGVAVVLTKADKNEAVAWCKRMWKAYPKDGGIPVKIGDIYDELREYAQAADYYQKALVLMDRYTEKLSIYFRLIDAQLNARLYPAAEKSCRDALKLEIRSFVLRKKLKLLLNRALDGQGKPKEE